MPFDQEQRYYAFRAEQERNAAARASDPQVAKLHSEMAERYETLANGAEMISHTAHQRPKPRSDRPSS